MSRAEVIEIQSSSTNESIELDENEFFVESNQTNSRMLFQLRLQASTAVRQKLKISILTSQLILPPII